MIYENPQLLKHSEFYQGIDNKLHGHVEKTTDIQAKNQRWKAKNCTFWGLGRRLVAVNRLQINPFTRDPQFNRLLASLTTIQTDLVLAQTSDKSIIKSANNASDYNFTDYVRKS